MRKCSSLLAGLLVIVLIPDIRYSEVAFESQARISAQRNLERARHHAGQESNASFWRDMRRSYPGVPSIFGYVVIRRSQRNASTVNQGSGNVVANEAGVIGEASAK